MKKSSTVCKSMFYACTTNQIIHNTSTHTKCNVSPGQVNRGLVGLMLQCEVQLNFHEYYSVLAQTGCTARRQWQPDGPEAESLY